MMSGNDDLNPETFKEKFAKELGVLEKEGYFNSCMQSVLSKLMT
jgi:hypothetical protein